jgi:hypothetical protein
MRSRDAAVSDVSEPEKKADKTSSTRIAAKDMTMVMSMDR